MWLLGLSVMSAAIASKKEPLINLIRSHLPPPAITVNSPQSWQANNTTEADLVKKLAHCQINTTESKTNR